MVLYVFNNVVCEGFVSSFISCGGTVPFIAVVTPGKGIMSSRIGEGGGGF